MGQQELPVALSDSFVSKLRAYSDGKDILDITDTNSECNSSTDTPIFTIRYSVPPNDLVSADRKLNLRKTSRLEFIVEDSPYGKAVHAETTTSAVGNKGSFRGQANSCKDTDCVLLYNQELCSYELHFLGIDIQVSPALKGRPRIGTPVESPRASTTSASVELNRSGSASLVAKVPTKVRLPTRRKRIPKAKPVNKSSTDTVHSLEPAKKISVIAKMTLPKQLRDSALSSSSTPSSTNQESHTLMKSTLSSLSTDSSTVSLSPTNKNFDDEFEDLADELADELMEDSEEEVGSTRLVGTAGGSAEDDDSSEEE